jgi:hypothetical protein
VGHSPHEHTEAVGLTQRCRHVARSRVSWRDYAGVYFPARTPVTTISATPARHKTAQRPRGYRILPIRPATRRFMPAAMRELVRRRLKEAARYRLWL